VSPGLGPIASPDRQQRKLCVGDGHRLGGAEPTLDCGCEICDRALGVAEVVRRLVEARAVEWREQLAVDLDLVEVAACPPIFSTCSAGQAMLLCR